MSNHATHCARTGKLQRVRVYSRYCMSAAGAVEPCRNIRGCLVTRCVCDTQFMGSSSSSGVCLECLRGSYKLLLETGGSRCRTCPANSDTLDPFSTHLSGSTDVGATLDTWVQTLMNSSVQTSGNAPNAILASTNPALGLHHASSVLLIYTPCIARSPQKMKCSTATGVRYDFPGIRRHKNATHARVTNSTIRQGTVCVSSVPHHHMYL